MAAALLNFITHNDQHIAQKGNANNELLFYLFLKINFGILELFFAINTHKG